VITHTARRLRRSPPAEALVAAVVVCAIAGWAPASGHAAFNVHYCDGLHTVWVHGGATCAKARAVNLAYGRVCSDEISVAGAEGSISCNRRAGGYRCRSTGTAYDAIVCRRGVRRVRFQLAE